MKTSPPAEKMVTTDESSRQKIKRPPSRRGRLAATILLLCAGVTATVLLAPRGDDTLPLVSDSATPGVADSVPSTHNVLSLAFAATPQNPLALLLDDRAIDVSSPGHPQRRQQVASFTDPASQAVKALYESTGGAGWKDKRNWLTGDPCTWKGVVCIGGVVDKV